MQYAIREFDFEAPISLTLPENCSGIAIDVRRGPRPVGFLMGPVAAGSTLTADQIQAWVKRDIETACLEQPVVSAQSGRSMPSTTIVICTKDHPDLLARCLTSISRLALPEGSEQPDVLVVDNASRTQETREVALSFPGVRYVLEKQIGLNFARNRALAEARGEILAFIDDDAVADVNWLNGLRQAWALEPAAGAFTGQTLPYALATEAQITVEKMGGFRKGFLPVVFREQHRSDPLYPCTTIFGNGCNMAFRVDVMRDLGGFDVALDMGAPLPGGGDLDALYSIVRSGHALVYEPQMLIRHEHRPDMEGLRRQIRRSWGTGCMAFLTKMRDTDPLMRNKARQFIYWWIRSMLRQLVDLRHEPADMPRPLLLQQFVGAIIGLTGTYGRCRRLADRIRNQASG
ncbi:glycosyltransferase [Rhizobium sp. TH2]|uniref:glycosyltransferase family 2 protein n=1 Tax=Rhizobium sp. TH2 TaxID=2775403 RepID=UPI002157536B|nr:glycosyltransferase family 2 protein [Rhizobium sp. TH2]UVC11648.1 glycosyltransferase [Rhizobium sp. TH2]